MENNIINEKVRFTYRKEAEDQLRERDKINIRTFPKTRGDITEHNHKAWCHKKTKDKGPP